MTTRRHLFRIASASVVGAALCGGTEVFAQAAPLDEKDPTASALGYVADATKADKAKFPKYAAGQMCGNCQLYQGGAAATGACPIFGGKIVQSKGWCSAYSKKA